MKTVFKALADPNRQAILRTLADGPLYAGDLRMQAVSAEEWRLGSSTGIAATLCAAKT